MKPGKFEVSVERYNDIIALFKKENRVYSEQTIGSRKRLHYNSRMVATTVLCGSSLDIGDISHPQFVGFLAMFSKHLYSQFKKHPDLHDLNIKFTGFARSKNLKFWATMKPKCYFYNIDLDSAYWQMLYKLGYITEKVFNNYKGVDDYKQAKRYCVSFLARDIKMNHSNGEIMRCDTTVFRNVYMNVRHCLYGCISESIKGIDNYIEYNIDGVTVMNTDLDVVRRRLTAMGLTFKVTQCRKISDTEYEYGSKIRKFKK